VSSCAIATPIIAALSAASLRDMGYTNARFIGGGLNAWRKLPA
jgi:rhodanese-related sulfurtransferase